MWGEAQRHHTVKEIQLPPLVCRVPQCTRRIGDSTVMVCRALRHQTTMMVHPQNMGLWFPVVSVHPPQRRVEEFLLSTLPWAKFRDRVRQTKAQQLQGRVWSELLTSSEAGAQPFINSLPTPPGPPDLLWIWPPKTEIHTGGGEFINRSEARFAIPLAWHRTYFGPEARNREKIGKI